MSLFSFLRFRAVPLDREQVELFNGVLTRPLNTFVIEGFTMICTNEDTKLINEIMRDFTNITKIAAIFVNNRGKVLSQEYNFSPFCKVVRRNPAYAKRCNQCDLYGGLDATKELSSCPYRCHMGLIDFSVPIMKDGAILGFIMAGQTKTEDTTIKPILPTQTDWHDDTKLRALYQALPVLTAEQIYSATKVLRILVEHYFPFNDAIAEEMPYEQLPDFVESERPINRPEIRKAMLYIEKNLSKRVSLRRISEHIHLSESYFSKIFKDDTGLSVVQYITLLRIQEAKKLLVYSQLTVNQISKTLGYNRTSYFCKIFKMATTETPHSYRKKYAKPIHP